MSTKKKTPTKFTKKPDLTALVNEKREELRLAELHGRMDAAKRLRDELNQLEN